MADEAAFRDRRPGNFRRDGLAWLGLALATLVVCWPLGLTNRVLAGVDAFTYFTPYWAYRMAEFQAGRLPLWNPYLFLGAPFLANPQAAVLYPLHWPLSWLTPAQALVGSALLHVWLAAGFTYTFSRRVLGISRSAAWLAGALFGLGGFTLAKIENINQLNTLAWLPALLWIYHEVRHAATGRGRIRWGAAFSVALALQLLAGHTQTAFVNLCGLGVWALWPADRPAGGFRSLVKRLLPLVALLPALLLAAAQLLPTLELNGLGLRTGGLAYRQAVSFSLRPRLLAQTFLPPFGGGLAEAFASEGYAEFAGYIGVAGLILACVGAASLWLRQGANGNGQIANSKWQIANGGLLALIAVGFLLALGAYNPLYYLLWRFVPGFDLFRAPARWLALYALGVAGLAGVGLDAAFALMQKPHPSPASRKPRGSAHAKRAPLDWELLRRSWRSNAARYLPPLVLGLALVALVVVQQFPSWRAVAGWVAAAGLTVGLLWIGGPPASWRWPLIALVVAELWLGGRALPFVQATAPASLSWRNAPAALLAAMADQPAAGRPRFLSLSDIRYDPGDLAELRALQADRLPAEAVERYVRAAKWTEVIAPNLSLSLRLPAVDGYDGGLLPTADYGLLQTLFLPPETLLPDGRLREQLHAIPPDRLLDLTGVRFVITDKQNDLWADDVYYDLEQSVLLQPGETLTLRLAAAPAFPATAVGIVAATAGDSARAEIGLRDAAGQAVSLPLIVAAAAAGQPPRPTVLALPAPQAPMTITVQASPAATTALTLRGLSLIDRRTGAHQSVTLSPRGDLQRIHSGDVKVYERGGALGRVWLAHGVQPVADSAAALRVLADPRFDPRTATTLTGDYAAEPPAAMQADESVTVIAYDAAHLIVRAEVRRPALLVLADANFPGWGATVDGVPAPILRANLMFRAVSLQPGTHEIVFSYDPWVWRWGARISLAALVGLLSGVLATFLRRRP